MAGRTIGDIAPAALGYLDRLAERFDGSLARAWEATTGRWLQDAEAYVTHPSATPLLMVPVWAEEMARPVPDEVVADCCGAAIVGYMAIRVQDDFVDDGIGDPVESMLLSTAVFTEAQALLARHVSGARFWDEYARLMTGYCDAMVFERELRRRPGSYDEAAFDRVLRRSAAMAIPGLAVLDYADSWDQAPQLSELVSHIVRAIQIADDVRDLRADVAAENWTWVGTRLGVHDDPESVAASLMRNFDGFLDEAAAEFAAAEEIAARHESTSAGSWLAEARDTLEQYRARFWEQAFDPAG